MAIGTAGEVEQHVDVMVALSLGGMRHILTRRQEEGECEVPRVEDNPTVRSGGGVSIFVEERKA